ncbi:MAG: pantoate--beta-alanine ligase [Abditibacteriota bacterium]|nr:pantoate--beta-alanine ligase [Abditibacteriota bacterium]
MQIINDPGALELLCANTRDAIGLVPTMGALHEGHLSLIEKARKFTQFVVVSDFVNPTQFGAGEDLDRYPRTLERDAERCREAGADVLFAPSAGDMYPQGFSSWAATEGVTEILEGALRPGHFRGVTTVCLKLFNMTRCRKAFFGQKDYQQLCVIKKLVRDLNVPVEIVPCATVREADGLAKSSRNAYLTPDERERALSISRGLFAAREAFRNGCADPREIEAVCLREIETSRPVKVDYVTLREQDTLEPAARVRGSVLLAAVRYDSARLIDNLILQ